MLADKYAAGRPIPAHSLKRAKTILTFCDDREKTEAVLWTEDIRNLVALAEGNLTTSQKSVMGSTIADSDGDDGA